MKRRTSRIITRVIVFLLLGAIVNLAVAWAIARWALPPTHDPFLYQENRVDDAAPDLHWTEPAWLPANWPAHPMGRSGEFSPYAHREFFRAEVDTEQGIAARREKARISNAPNVQRHADAMEVAEVNVEFAAMFVEIGWPCLALSGARFEHEVKQSAGTPMWSPKGSTLKYAIELPVPPSPTAWMERGTLLPWRPMWPGFAINTVFYAVIVWGCWLVLSVPFVLRRRRRIKRGLCPACAYPIGESEVCTECGAAVRPAPR
jgi:hypothetical protein